MTDPARGLLRVPPPTAPRTLRLLAVVIAVVVAPLVTSTVGTHLRPAPRPNPCWSTCAPRRLQPGDDVVVTVQLRAAHPARRSSSCTSRPTTAGLAAPSSWPASPPACRCCGRSAPRCRSPTPSKVGTACGCCAARSGRPTPPWPTPASGSAPSPPRSPRLGAEAVGVWEPRWASWATAARARRSRWTWSSGRRHRGPGPGLHVPGGRRRHLVGTDPHPPRARRRHGRGCGTLVTNVYGRTVTVDYAGRMTVLVQAA